MFSPPHLFSSFSRLCTHATSHSPEIAIGEPLGEPPGHFPGSLFLDERPADGSSILSRYREAIECLKRALIGASQFETAIRLRMAGIYKMLGEQDEAVACHTYIVNTYSADSK